MPAETPSFPSTAVTRMFVLYPPTFPPHHPSFLGESSAPGHRGACRGVPGRGPSSSRKNLRGAASSPGPGGRATVPLRAPSLGLPLHTPGARACGGSPSLQAPLSLGVSSPPSCLPLSLQGLRDGGCYGTGRPGLGRAVMCPVAFFPVGLADISAL